jgi:hypothetical protein
LGVGGEAFDYGVDARGCEALREILRGKFCGHVWGRLGGCLVIVLVVRTGAYFGGRESSEVHGHT